MYIIIIIIAHCLTCQDCKSMDWAGSIQEVWQKQVQNQVHKVLVPWNKYFVLVYLYYSSEQWMAQVIEIMVSSG